MSAGLKIVLCIAFALGTTTALPTPYNMTIARSVMEKYHQDMRHFPCSIPQNRTYLITDLIQRGLNPGDQLATHYTVIRRCDCGTGICINNNHTCGPMTIEKQTIQLMVVSMKNVKRFPTLKVEHHKTCHCQLKSKTNENTKPVVEFKEDVQTQ